MDFNYIEMAFGVVIAVLGYFLKGTMEEIKSLRRESVEHSSNIALIKVDYAHKFESLSEKVAELKDTLNLLIAEIKSLNAAMHKGKGA